MRLSNSASPTDGAKGALSDIGTLLVRNIRIKSDTPTYKTSLGGAKHSEWTIFVIISMTSASSWQIGRHVEVGSNISAYTSTNETLLLFLILENCLGTTKKITDIFNYLNK